MEVRTKDYPEANGRIPQKGEQRFSLTFPLEDGQSLIVHMGRESMNYFESFLAQMMFDDAKDEGR
jgi:hypothetical protein